MEIATVGIDLAKNVFQVHGINLTAAVDEVTKRLQFFRGASMMVAKTVASKVQQDGMTSPTSAQQRRRNGSGAYIRELARNRRRTKTMAPSTRGSTNSAHKSPWYSE